MTSLSGARRQTARQATAARTDLLKVTRQSRQKALQLQAFVNAAIGDTLTRVGPDFQRQSCRRVSPACPARVASITTRARTHRALSPSSHVVKVKRQNVVDNHAHCEKGVALVKEEQQRAGEKVETLSATGLLASSPRTTTTETCLSVAERGVTRGKGAQHVGEPPLHDAASLIGQLPKRNEQLKKTSKFL